MAGYARLNLLLGRDFDKALFKALRKEVQPKLTLAAANISKRLQDRFKQLIWDHNTVRALISGSSQGGVNLRGELGVNTPTARLRTIIETLAQQLVLTNKPLKVQANGLRGGFRLQMIEADWRKVTNLNEAWIKERTKVDFPWLDWLLTQGSKVVVREYDVHIQVGTGRTGKAHMRKNYNRKMWNVPPEFSGTTKDNFVTDILDILEIELKQIMPQELKKIT